MTLVAAPGTRELRLSKSYAFNSTAGVVGPMPAVVVRAPRSFRCFSAVSTSRTRHAKLLSMEMPVVTSGGARVPVIGLGTWDLRGRTCARVVEQALRLGYRHVDTAEMYDNEHEVGEGLRASAVPRDEVFVVTKIWPSHFAPRELERSAKESLARLQLANVDLLLLHWPIRRFRSRTRSARSAMPNKQV